MRKFVVMESILIICLFALIMGGVIYFQQSALNRSRNALYKLEKERISYIRLNAELKAQLNLKEELLLGQQNELLQTKEQLHKDFQLLATKIIEEKTARFTLANQNNIEAILKPLNERLVEFKARVEETYDKESKQRFSLEERIKELVALNAQISDDANNLTKALRGESKVQGNWGEMILETILEKSGLKKGTEYHVQSFLKDEDGNLIKNNANQKMQPDVIIEYPGGRKVIVDSKVSLSAYVRYCESEDEKDRVGAEKDHLASVKQHIDELSNKAYQDYIESVDFVMMFIPNEPAYILAMKLDPNLWDYAYKRRILIINPTNLIASLRVVADLWKRDAQSQNAQEIAERGAILYDKFAGFVESIQEVGVNIEKSQRAYDKAYSQLSTGKGNLIRQAEMLKELGVKSQKELPKEDV